MKTCSLFALAGAVTLMVLNAHNAMAQPFNFDFRNFDPAQMQKRMMDGYREQLEVSDDAEWKIIEQRIQRVMDARREIGFGGALRGMARMFGGGGQGGGAQRSGGFGGFAPPVSTEEEALQKAFDAKAPKAELKAALAKFIEARQRKQADLQKAQADLREVLSLRQEVSATLSGLL
jgi:hypothetical protein